LNKNSIAIDLGGPVIINNDGTISRISNWDQMTENEKEMTVKIITKRNQERKKILE
jgi:hypothetical protein